MVGLREINAGDKEKIRDWRNLPDIAKYMYTDHQITEEEHEKWFNAIAEDPKRKYWVITYNNEDIGLVNLYDIDKSNQRCYWALYIVDTNAQRKGIGGFVELAIINHVFGEMGFNRLCCEVLDFNQSVIKAHKGFGFVEEGCLRQHVIKNGQPVDVISFGLLKEEWEQKKPDVEKRLSRIEKWLKEKEETSREE